MAIEAGGEAHRSSGHRAQNEEDDATDENGRQDESARDIASSDMHRSGLPCDQPNGPSAPSSTDMTTVPDMGVKRTSVAQPSRALRLWRESGALSILIPAFANISPLVIDARLL